MNPIHLSDDIAIHILSNSDALTVSRIDFAAHAVAALHHHPHEEINYVLSGRMAIRVEGVDHVVGPGETVRVPPNVEHNITDLGDAGQVLSVWSPSRTDLIARAQKA